MNLAPPIVRSAQSEEEVVDNFTDLGSSICSNRDTEKKVNYRVNKPFDCMQPAWKDLDMQECLTHKNVVLQQPCLSHPPIGPWDLAD